MFCKEPLLLLILLQPLQAAKVRQMGNLKALETRLKAISIGTSRHHTNHYRGIVREVAIAHHHIVFIVKRVENLHRIKSAHRLNPNKIDTLVECDYRPIASLLFLMLHDSGSLNHCIYSSVCACTAIAATTIAKKVVILLIVRVIYWFSSTKIMIFSYICGVESKILGEHISKEALCLFLCVKSLGNLITVYKNCLTVFTHIA